MSPQPFLHALLRQVFLVTTITAAGALAVHAQEASPPAYLAVVAGEAALERDGVEEPAVQNMPFVAGDRLRTGAGRVEIVFPDGSGIEVGEYSEVEAVSPTRVRLIAGTMDHLQRPAAGSRSATYLPPDLQTYGSTFDQYGSWQYDSPYGYVWYPAVAPDWRPYYHGSWSPIRSYGWTWIGRDAWAWPTHHYGRWGYARNAWFWIPGRTWGAAWVSWSFADDYVSWCPLGYDSRPVFALSVGHRRAWDHWTVPRRGFGTRGAYAGSYARDYRVGGRESVVGSRAGRPATNDRRTTTTDPRPTTNFRRPPQTTPTLPAASAGAIAMPRAQPGATTDYRRPTTDYRQRTDVAVPRATPPERVYMPPPSYRGREQPQRNGYAPAAQPPALAGASGGAVAPRPPSTDYRRPTTDSRPPTVDYRRPTADARPPTAEYRRPTADSRPPTTGSRPSREAPAASGGAPATRSMPHERAAPAGGEARPRAEGRRPR